MASELRGVLCAMATPFTAGGERVDEGALRALVDGLLDAGIHGLVPCGSTGEFPALSDEERKRVVEVVVEQVAGRALVVPHTGATGTRIAIELSRHAEAAGADAVLAVHPYYLVPSLEEIHGFYADLAGAVSIPVAAYNFPNVTGITLDAPFLARLGREIEGLAYVKDTSGDLSRISELVLEFPDDVTVLNGWDTIAYSALELGTSSTILGCANVVPAQCAELFALVEEGRLEEARALWARVWPVTKFLMSRGYVGAVKAGAELCGLPAGEPRAPFHTLPAEDREELRRLLVAAGAVSEGAAA